MPEKDLTVAEISALADAAQLILATRTQYAHVPAITKNFPVLETARGKLVARALTALALPREEKVVLEELEFELVRPLRESGVNDDVRACLLATVDILGASHHLEAIAVHYDRARQEWLADDPEYQEGLDHFALAAGDGGPFETVRIEDRLYVLVMTPYRR